MVTIRRLSRDFGHKAGCRLALVKQLTRDDVAKRMRPARQAVTLADERHLSDSAARRATQRHLSGMQGVTLSGGAEVAALTTVGGSGGWERHSENGSVLDRSGSSDTSFGLKQLAVRTFELQSFRSDLRLTEEALHRWGPSSQRLSCVQQKLYHASM